ncbi:MAG TPA: heparinase II/III family protein [Stellaceae bacterium]|nr:heparinase II/III family protein [Stellaceae bacterium]
MQSARAAFYGSAPYHLTLWGRRPRSLAFRLPAKWPGDAAAGATLLEGGFRFLGESAQERMPPWTADRRPEWLAELHRFRWLADLAAVGQDAAATARAWTADWVQRYAVFEPLAWRPDVMGDRLFAWIEHFDLIAGADDQATGDWQADLLRSLAQQTRHLARVAGREGAGLDRLAALRGLVAASAALRQEGRLARALRALDREIGAQILPDGGHQARSPAAQLAALRLLIDAHAALAAAGRAVPGELQQAIDRAAPMLRFFRHGDGRLALFNGADEGDAAMLELVLARGEAKGRPPASAPYVGFERLQGGGTVVLADCGKPAPPGFRDEAHAGTLSFEMSHGRERIIVNCGAYQGASAEWRMATRATAAHSTLIVADTNSTEIRPDGALGPGPENVTCQRVEDNGSQLVTASHDGYRHNFGLVHGRQLFLAADGEDLRGEDRLTGEAGRGFAIRFHLHPDVEAALSPEGNTLLLRLPSGMAWRLRTSGAVMSLGESVYLGDGAARKTQQIVLDGHVGTTGAHVRWALRRE